MIAVSLKEPDDLVSLFLNKEADVNAKSILHYFYLLFLFPNTHT